jgi:uncharacterized protein YkwD
VLIKEDHTEEMGSSLPKNINDTSNKKVVTEKPNEGLALLIGQDLTNVQKQWGSPVRIDESLYGFQWYIYNEDYGRYLQIGVENNRVVTVYAIGENLNVAPFEIGQPVEEIFNTQFIDTNINLDWQGGTYRFELSDTDLNLRPLVQLGDLYVQLYIDKFTGTLSSVRFLNAETLIKQRPYELVYRGELVKDPELTDEAWKMIEQGTEQQIFDITNVLRVRNQLKPLKWDEITSEVAYGHSKDMYENNDYSHISKKFGDLANRLQAAKVAYDDAGENIAANYTDGPAVVEGWLNSKSHREALLNKNYSHLGVGVFRKYYTQNFIKRVD